MSEEMDYTLGFVMKLAEAGVTLDQAEKFVFSKKADSDSEPKISRRAFERIYEKTRKKLRSEINRSDAGDSSIVWQGFRNPITGAIRFPLSIGSRRSNDVNATMTPAQANLVALLTKHRNINGYRGVQRKFKNFHPDFEFMADPTTFNADKGKLTNRGQKDLKKAYKHVFGYEPTDDILGMLTSRLFGTNSGFDGTNHIFGSERRMV